MSDIKGLVAGNWKMNGTAASLAEVAKLADLLAVGSEATCDVLICPPATLIHRMSQKVEGTIIAVGGQDCHSGENGAHTGDIAAEMIADSGGQYVIVGHSERRQDHGEGDSLIAEKAKAAWRARLTAIICVGESDAQREAGKTESVVIEQLKGSIPEGANNLNTIIAYEPIWAIGTGKTPTAGDVEAVHNAIRGYLVDRFVGEGEGMRILYGGSVKPSNAKELMGVKNVNGALVGGASLKADDLNGIIEAYRG